MQTIQEVLATFRQAFGEQVFCEVDTENQGDIFTAIEREKGHQFCKKELGDRVQILRVLICRHFKPKLKEMSSYEFYQRVEKYLDTILVKNNYRLESLIDKFRKYQ